MKLWLLALVGVFRVTLSMRQYRYALTKDLSKFYQRVNAALDDLCGILPLGKCKLFVFLYKKLSNYDGKHLLCKI
jgi:hypothetical protein